MAPNRFSIIRLGIEMHLPIYFFFCTSIQHDQMRVHFWTFVHHSSGHFSSNVSIRGFSCPAVPISFWSPDLRTGDLFTTNKDQQSVSQRRTAKLLSSHVGFRDAPLIRFMGALPWGRVIALPLRRPPSGATVYFCVTACVFKEGGPRWQNQRCGRDVWNKPVSSSSHRASIQTLWLLPISRYCSTS